MKTIIATLSHSNRKNKKFKVVLSSFNVEINFGDSRYEDYTSHKNEERKLNYINRHKSNEDWTNYLTPGFWSRWLLWNKKTIHESIMDIQNKFGIFVRYA